jgi:hypothetical protein
MNSNLVRVIGTTTQDNLIAKLSPPAETFGIQIPAGAGSLARGTVLQWNGTAYSVLGTDVEKATANCILADPVDASGASAVTAVAYRSGNFNKAALIVADGYTITAADVDQLRQYDIILTETM